MQYFGVAFRVQTHVIAAVNYIFGFEAAMAFAQLVV
jgi:hypothetical protein